MIITNFLFSLTGYKSINHLNLMQHSSDQLIDAFFKKNTHKSDQELSNLIKALFQSPTTLLNHIHSLNNQRGAQSGLDIAQIFKLYQNISHFKKDNDLLVLFNKTLNELVTEVSFKSYLKSSEQMKYFLIVVLWDKLFKIKQYEFVTTRVLEDIQRAQQYRDVFSHWLQDIPADYIKLMISYINSQLQVLCNSLVQKQQTEQSNRETSKKCQTFCYFLKLLYLSNKNKPRLPIKQFNSKFLTKFFQPVEQFKIYITKSQDFNFVSYPFLFDFQYKHKLMQIQSIYEQKMNIKKSMERGFSALLQSFDYNGNLSIQGLIYLYIPVNRNNILDDSMQKLGKVKQNLKSPLRIQFIGEEGTDEGGVKNQYFSLITKSIFNPYLDMFIPKNKGIYYWFNGFSYEMPLRFQFVGMLLGLALYNSVHLDIHFPEVVYKKLLNKKYEEDHGLQIIDDLREIEPDVHRTLKEILAATQSLDELQLYFNIQLQSFGQIIVQQLVEGGNFIKLSLDNRQEYCLLYADFVLNRHISKQFTPFRKGFYKVVAGGMIETFEAQQLLMLINGKEEINIKELEQSTTYQGGYTRQTTIIRYFWEFLYTLNEEEKKNFMIFVTGTDRVPIEGLKSLKFNIQRHSNITNLPTAHTCFNVLLLPQYTSREMLTKMMRLALEHNQGFGLI